MKITRHMSKKFTIFLLFIVGIIQAEVKLPAIVSSNMVLQRNTTVKLWGWANPNEHISITTSWLHDDLHLQANSTGNWSVLVATTNSKEPQIITIKSKASNIVLDNILFGEVWLCSGQSNMQQPLKGYVGQPTFGGNLASAKSNNFNLRLFTVHRQGSKTLLNDVQEYQSWQQASPETTSNFSAVAYFFGKQLQEVLDVPVGLIHTSWGGSSIQAWMSNEILRKYETVALEDVDISKQTNRIPTALFNAMINPIINFSIKGVLWYQGESNRLNPSEYKKLFPAMVNDWRTRWAIGDFPFYYVQIAPFLYVSNHFYNTPKNSAFIREVQLQCVDIIPNSGIAITMDIGDKNCIHPPEKKEVANRLLLNALNQTYGFTNIEFQSATYHSLENKDGGLLLKFKNAEMGLFAHDTLLGFEIAGNDKIFHPADAKIKDNKFVFVKSEMVTQPIAVRYAWRNWIDVNFYNTNMLPVSSFRTDDWDDATLVSNKNQVEN